MRILLVHPGASWSTADVHHGILTSLQKRGVEIIKYNLDGRTAVSESWLNHVWSRVDIPGKPPEPSEADILYHASLGILERALRHDVDWVFLISGTFFHPEVLTLLKRAGFKIACLLTESPYQDRQEIIIAKMADVIWTNERSAVATFKPYCHHVYYYQHAMDPIRHQSGPADPTVPVHDVVFVGTGFIERCDALEAVNWDGIDLGLYGTWDLLQDDSPLRAHLQDGIVPNEWTAQLYRAAKIGLNIHRTSMGWGLDATHIYGAESMNPRCYELAATGTFFVTDYRPEVEEVFGDLVPTYRGAGELEDLLRYWLAHDEARHRIAQQLPERVKEHNFDNRADEMLSILAHYR